MLHVTNTVVKMIRYYYRTLIKTATVCSFLRPSISAFLPFARLPGVVGISSSSYSKVCAAAASTTTTMTCTDNPLLADWSNQPYLLPPFAEIEASHFPSALEEGMRAHMDDLKAIVNDAATPDFENVVAAYDRSGRMLDRVGSVFSNLCSSKNTEDLQKVQTEMAPIMSRHQSGVYQLPGLFDKINTVFQMRAHLDLTPEQMRLTERIHMDFTRAGAALAADKQAELADIKAELASLTTAFTQNVLKDEEETYFVWTKDDLAGCPDFLIEAARNAALERKKGDDDCVITLSRSLVEPFLTCSDRRDLREQAWRAWTKRGELNEDRDNRNIAVQILKLRQRIALIHGYPTFAAYQCVDRMAQTPSNVMELLENVWARAKVSAEKERKDMEEFLKESGVELVGGIQPYDWRYYAEKVRKAKYDFDEALLKPYLSLDSVRESLFAVSGNLFGLRYSKVENVAAYHPDVDVYEVRETLPDGSDRLLSIFIHDNFSRPFKSGGAWMSEYRGQTKNLAPSSDAMEGIPIISNNNNFAKGTHQTLLSYDDAKTMFHEFGHAHHGMLSDATYARLAGTSVLTDWVELPSQLFEHWLSYAFKNARHFETGEAVPMDLVEKLEKANTFQQGFQTVEYTSCALLDMALHQIEDYTNFDMEEFERTELERLGMPQGIVMRHRPAHFQHLFSTSMYAAGYYVYLWAESLDADAFAAFEETGDIFDPVTAARAREFIYGSGNTEAPDVLFRAFRGRDPDIKFMLKKKGLSTEN